MLTTKSDTTDEPSVAEQLQSLRDQFQAADEARIAELQRLRIQADEQDAAIQAKRLDVVGLRNREEVRETLEPLTAVYEHQSKQLMNQILQVLGKQVPKEKAEPKKKAKKLPKPLAAALSEFDESASALLAQVQEILQSGQSSQDQVSGLLKQALLKLNAAFEKALGQFEQGDEQVRAMEAEIVPMEEALYDLMGQQLEQAKNCLRELQAFKVNELKLMIQMEQDEPRQAELVQKLAEAESALEAPSKVNGEQARSIEGKRAELRLHKTEYLEALVHSAREEREADEPRSTLTRSLAAVQKAPPFTSPQKASSPKDGEPLAAKILVELQHFWAQETARFMKRLAQEQAERQAEHQAAEAKLKEVEQACQDIEEEYEGMFDVVKGQYEDAQKRFKREAEAHEQTLREKEELARKFKAAQSQLTPSFNSLGSMSPSHRTRARRPLTPLRDGAENTPLGTTPAASPQVVYTGGVRNSSLK